MSHLELCIHQASCFNTNSNADCCEQADISISNALLERVSSLQALVIKHDLDTIAAYSNDVLWGSEDFETEYGLEGTKLVVAKTCFWFSNTIKHCEGELQTESMSTHQLKQLLAKTCTS